MNKLRIALFILAMAGLLISSYLTYAYVFGGPILCNGGHGCEEVRASQQANFFGVPTPAYGVLFYVVLAGLAWLIGVVKESWLLGALRLWTAGGVVVSAYLTYLEAFVINAWCWWCVASAVVATLAFLVVWCLLSDDSSNDTVKAL
jgi:uncharacterized membrane protein